MEETPVTPPQVPPAPDPVNVSKRTTFGLKALIILGVFVLVLGGTVAWVATQQPGGGSEDQENTQQNTTRAAAPKSTIIYGYWTSEASIINALDTSTGTNKILATLPSNIKHLKVISPTALMYIKNTDERDYGTEIVVRSLNTNVDTSVFKADDGFGIDDYVVSPDGNYAAVWQVAPPADSVRLRGGQSRVTTFMVSQPTSKNIIYDEVSNVPVHYPVAVTNAGGVYLDKFLPNAEAGWAYGLSFSNFNGSVQEEIDSMAHGTYSTQPVQSPDGNKLVFAGYDGSKGSGTAVVGGFRRALAVPNTVETFDLVTRVRTVLATSENAIFPSAYWDPQSDYVMYSTISQNPDESGVYVYDFRSSQSQKFTTPQTDAEGVAVSVSNVYATLPGGTVFVVDEAVDQAAMGNLGSKYAPSITALYALTPSTGGKTRIALNGEHLQLIGLKGDRFFPENVGTANAVTEKDKQLQLQTFTLKPSLAPMRQEQQSGNRCRDVAAAQCNQLHGTNFTGDQARKGVGGTIDHPEFNQCFTQQFAANRMAGTCSDSPLYLYGPEGLNVKVMPGTTIYSPNVSYEQNGFDITLGKNGSFTANGTTVNSLAFDYNPAIKVSRPAKGSVVERSKLAQVIRIFAEKLGLNGQETVDTVSYAKSVATGNYVFLSFYDHVTSQKILPLYFEPVPDSYRNIVFYLENLKENAMVSYDLPKFEKVSRGGFTAVEISFIVK